jgi:hypothetical protein
MENFLKYPKFSQKIEEFFKGKIKLTFSCYCATIFLTEDDKIYKFNTLNGVDLFIFLGDNDYKIESAIMEDICDKEIVDIVSGLYHIIARSKNGNIYCWGENSFGQLGNGKIDSATTNKPELNLHLRNENVIDVCCGYKFSIALTDKGDVFTWGDNTYGQIGRYEINGAQNIPFKIDKILIGKAKAIACGGNHSFVLTENEKVFSWGLNKSGQLGHGDYEFCVEPTQVFIDQPIVKICCGAYHTLLLSKEEDIFILGDTFAYIPQSGPQRFGLVKVEHSKKFKDIATHSRFTDSFAVSVDNIYYMWGNCGDEIIYKPKETPFESFNDLFKSLYGMTLKAYKGYLAFDINLFRKGFYKLNFNEEEKIGNGSFGEVFRVKNKYLNDTYAIKKIKFKVENVDKLEKAMKVFSIVITLDSNFIVKFKETWFELEENNNIEPERKAILYIYMDLYEETLAHIINELNNKIFKLDDDDDTFKSICYFVLSQLFIQLLEGVIYLHKHYPPLIHRDLKPSNILINKELDGRFVKLADFDLLTIHEFAEQTHSNNVGTFNYIAPEVSKGKNYNTKADVYSLGAIMEYLFNLNLNK